MCSVGFGFSFGAFFILHTQMTRSKMLTMTSTVALTTVALHHVQQKSTGRDPLHQVNERRLHTPTTLQMSTVPAATMAIPVPSASSPTAPRARHSKKKNRTKMRKKSGKKAEKKRPESGDTVAKKPHEVRAEKKRTRFWLPKAEKKRKHKSGKKRKKSG